MKTLLAWWQERDAKERLWLALGLAGLGLILLVSVLVEPALTARRQLLDALPRLREQVASMDSQAQEAHALLAQGSIKTPAGEALRASLEGSLREHGFETTKLTLVGTGVRLQLHDVAFAEWTAWLDEVRQQAHVKVSEAHVTALKPGQVDLTATLTPP